MEMTKTEKELLDSMNGQEIISTYFEGVVGVVGDMVILPYMEGIKRKITKKGIHILFSEMIYNEFGTTDTRKIMEMEGF